MTIEGNGIAHPAAGVVARPNREKRMVRIWSRMRSLRVPRKYLKEVPIYAAVAVLLVFVSFEIWQAAKRDCVAQCIEWTAWRPEAAS